MTHPRIPSQASSRGGGDGLAKGDPQSAVVGIAVTTWRSSSIRLVRRESAKIFESAEDLSRGGWDQEVTVQYEGIADEPSGSELDRLKESYLAVFPDGRDRQTWDGIAYFRIEPTWARYSDFNPGGEVFEFKAKELTV
jgi:hypothetical protein